jgi:hypothetical protein
MIILSVVTSILLGGINAQCACEELFSFPPAQYQWSHFGPQKLTKGGKQILHWLEDAQSCLPGPYLDEVPQRERVILSDLLRCATQKDTQDIANACCEFARTRPIPYVILQLLEPLVFASDGLEAAEYPSRAFGPWIIEDGKLTLPQASLQRHYGGSTGAPFHFKLLEKPLPKATRAILEPFKLQIIDEYSHWHLRK